MLRLQFCFQPLLHVWLRGLAISFPHWRSAVAQAASTSVTSTQCTTNSESNTMLWHVQLCYPAPTGENKLQKKICFRRGLHIPRVGLNLHPNIVLSVKCSGLQRWQTECFVCSLLHMRKSSIMDARWRKNKILTRMWYMLCYPRIDIHSLQNRSGRSSPSLSLTCSDCLTVLNGPRASGSLWRPLLKVFLGGHFAAFSGLCLQW